MHALTMLYSEVVQVYRFVVELPRKTRCIFVTMKLVTSTPEVLCRYRAVIASVGLIPEMGALSRTKRQTLSQWHCGGSSGTAAVGNTLKLTTKCRRVDVYSSALRA